MLTPFFHFLVQHGEMVASSNSDQCHRGCSSWHIRSNITPCNCPQKEKKRLIIYKRIKFLMKDVQVLKKIYKITSRILIDILFSL
jgi:hypothetical protein